MNTAQKLTGLVQPEPTQEDDPQAQIASLVSSQLSSSQDARETAADAPQEQPAQPTPQNETESAQDRPGPLAPPVEPVRVVNKTEDIQKEATQAVTPDSGGTPVAPTPSSQGNGMLNGDSFQSGESVADVLVKKGMITEAQLQDVRAESVTTGKKITDVLLEKELVSDLDLAQAQAEYYNVEFVKLSEMATTPEALTQIPESVARRYQIMPFDIDKGERELKVAMVNPLDLRAIDFVEKKTGFRVVPYMAAQSDLETAINERYAQSLSTEVTAALKETAPEQKKEVYDVKKLGEVVREAPIAKIVETILTFAIKARASDVHIEPQENKTRVRYRIDGILHEKLVLPRGVQDAVVSRIKILADLKIDEKRLPQDGRFSFRVAEEEVDLRVSTLPTVHGEKVVMRLLKKTQKVPSMMELGLRGTALKNLESSIRVPHGIILVTGPTGSGKTTTLYSILHKINTPHVNIMTLEDPVEYEMKGVNQVQANPQAGLTFASGLRSFLRQDPNIIMVGEIRDKETAELAVQASLTGHLVFSTLHTNSAAGALPRLQDMEVESFLLASSMTCVVAQRVVRKICEHCKKVYQPEPPVLEDIKQVLGPYLEAWLKNHKMTLEQLQLQKGEGCEECNDTGYKGRVGIFEVLPVSEKVGRLILENAPASKIEQQAVADGMMLMKQDGYLKVLEGTTTIEEVLRVAEI